MATQNNSKEVLLGKRFKYLPSFHYPSAAGCSKNLYNQPEFVSRARQYQYNVNPHSHLDQPINLKTKQKIKGFDFSLFRNRGRNLVALRQMLP